MQKVPQIRVFLASPGDVNEERAVALQVLDMLEYDPLFKRDGAGGVSIHAVAWDKPGSGTPMLATKTPQTAIREGLPRPSECDIVLVFFWGRMGTPLQHPEYQKEDGSPYLSGTEWEYLDAVTEERKHGKPITLIYRRTEEPRIDLKDRKQVTQYHAVLDFFDQFRDPKTGALLGGVNEYTTPEDLRLKLLIELRQLVDRVLSSDGAYIPEAALTESSGVMDRPRVEPPPLWEGSPFPGLRAFTPADAPIFFGRGIETDALIKRMSETRLVAVVGASESGKSSLVGAGLLPRLKANAIEGSKDWLLPDWNAEARSWIGVRFTPGEVGYNPFMALALKLAPLVNETPRDLAESLRKVPSSIIAVAELAIKERRPWAELLLFIDQFEELFTVVRAADLAPFVVLLEAIYTSRRLRCIVTMRSDFYANCLELPALAELLKEATYPLAAPTAGALLEMIKRPAERAGLTWDEGLPERIQADTGTDTGALALMAYALDELYQASHDDKRLTVEAYTALGGVEGAIGKRAADAFARLTLENKEQLLQHVFRELVTVNPQTGTATRQRALLSHFDSEELALIRAFTKARLLVTQDNIVEVAHEAIFRSWQWLKDWIAKAQEDLILLRQVLSDAAEWVRRGKPDFLLWPAERLKLVYEMLERQQPRLTDDERDFLEPEQERLLRELETLPSTADSHERRRDIGDRLAVIGDTRSGVGVKDGVPDLLWLPVEVSPNPVTIKADNLEIGPIIIPPFFIAKYLVTYEQFKAFLEAADGFDDDRWWKGMSEKYQKQEMEHPRTKTANAPRDTVSWYQCVAFACWMNDRLRGLELAHPSGDVLRVGENAEIRLPLEREWQWAAQAGAEARDYPWGAWAEGCANTSEAGLNRTTAVGMYPRGEAVCGALDMAGNLWEWCQNDRDDYRIIYGYDNGKSKVLRGGSFSYDRRGAYPTYRRNYYPYDRYFNVGLRLVVSVPIASLLSGESGL